MMEEQNLKILIPLNPAVSELHTNVVVALTVIKWKLGPKIDMHMYLLLYELMLTDVFWRL